MPNTARWLFVVAALFVPLLFYVWVQDDVVLPAAMSLLAAGYVSLAIRGRWLSLCGFVLLGHIVSYPVAALLNAPIENREIRPDLWQDAPLAMWACALGLFCFGLGAQLIDGMRGKRGGASGGARALTKPTSVLFNLALASTTILIAFVRMRLGIYFHSSINDDYNFGASQYLNALEYATAISWCGVFLQWYRWTVTRQKGDGFFAVLAALIPLAVYLPSGSRIQAVGFIPMLLIAYYSWEVRVRRKVLVSLTGVAVLVFASIAVQEYRNLAEPGAIDISTKYKQLIETSVNLDAARDDDERDFLARLSDFVAAGRIVAWTPDIYDYRYFEGMQEWWQIAIPKVLRPEDSELNFSEGGLVTLRYGVSAGDWSSTPITILGDLFSRFGWLGIAFGMIAIGMGVRALDFVAIDLGKGELWRTLFLLIAGKTIFFMYSMSLLIVVVTLTRDMLICFMLARVISVVNQLVSNGTVSLGAIPNISRSGRVS